MSKALLSQILKDSVELTGAAAGKTVRFKASPTLKKAV